MKQSNFISELLNGVVNVFDTIALCKEISSCKFGYGFVARSTPKFSAPKATAAEWYEWFGECMPKVVKVTKVTNARAYDYAKAVNRQLDKQGIEATFESSAMNGYEWVVPNIIKRATKDDSLQLCLSFKEGDKTRFETFYIVGDHLATAREMAFIKSHLYVAPNKSVKQTKMGVAQEDIIMVRNYKFNNIVKVGTTPQVEEFWASIIK